jgi:hypothetical protein
MNPNLAEENLQTIRQLMERSALYRRALAPIMLLTGVLGLGAAAAGLWFHLEASRSFAGLWIGTACVVVTAAFVLARRQALKDDEPFWSPPTYRVAQALLPPLLSGLALGVLLALLTEDWTMDFAMVLVWLLFYGCALHAAGFFMERGIKWFGWGFIVAALVLMAGIHVAGYTGAPAAANWLMGFFFGALHLAYGIYLSFTEQKKTAA